MAKATTKKEVTTYALELSKDEAEAVSAALAFVSGDSSKSPAKHTTAVYNALDNAGVRWNAPAVGLVVAPLYGGTGIRFNNYKTNGNS